MGKSEVYRFQTRLLKECCPVCDHIEGIPLVWGEVYEKTRRAWQRGEVSLAGCIVEYREDGSLPEYECQICKHRW